MEKIEGKKVDMYNPPFWRNHGIKSKDFDEWMVNYFKRIHDDIHGNNTPQDDQIPTPIMYGFPQIAENQKWQIEGYLFGKNVRKSMRKLDDWEAFQYIRCSNGVHHVIGDGKTVLVFSIQIKN
jgi:hypothetical protein